MNYMQWIMFAWFFGVGFTAGYLRGKGVGQVEGYLRHRAMNNHISRIANQTYVTTKQGFTKTDGLTK